MTEKISRIVEFESFEDYFGKHLYPTCFKLSGAGLSIVVAYFGIERFLWGGSPYPSWRFIHYLLGAIFIVLMMVSAKSRSFRGHRVAGIILSGNIGMVILTSVNVFPEYNPFAIEFVMMFFMFGVIIVAPLLTTKMFVIPNVTASLMIGAMLLIRRVDAADLINYFSFASLSSFFLLVTIQNQRKAALLQYRLARDNYLLSMVDSLSQLLNRQSWVMLTEASCRRAVRESKQVAFLMLDIDHFKRVNDTWGHTCGDRVIKAVSQTLLQSTRDSDLVGRLGGEEFGILIPLANRSEALVMAERIRKSVEETRIQFDGAVVSVTVSIGLVVAEPVDLRTLIKKGDAFLYQAKREGRNRVASNLHPTRKTAVFPLQVQWSEDFNSGVYAIDKGHQDLLNQINRLIQLAVTDEDQCKAQIKEIGETVKIHFQVEEQILKKMGWPAAAAHAEIHQEALRSLAVLWSDLDNRRITPFEVALQIYQSVILGHMVIEDTRFFKFLAENRAPEYAASEPREAA